MRRATDVFFAAAGAAGALYVFGFTFARATPPRWASAIALVVVLTALALFVLVYKVGGGRDPQDPRPDD